MNTDKIKRLILEATEDSNLRDKLRRDSRDVALLQAREYGANVPVTEKMLKYATRVGDPNKMSQAGEAYRATRLAKALGDDDLNYIIDHAKELNQQGKDALIQMLLERGETGKLYQLNKQLDNEFINRDLSQKFTRDQAKLLDEAVANKELENKFYSKVNDEQAAELSGMSMAPVDDPVRARLIADSIRHGKPVDTSVDEMFNANVTSKELANSPRYKRWVTDEERRLKGQLPDTPVRDVHPSRARVSGRNRASDIRDKSEILEEAINNRYGSVDNLRKTLRDVPEGSERIYDEAADLLNRYDEALDSRKIVDDLGDIDAENVMNQFMDPREQEWVKPTPRSRDYGEETMILRDRKKGVGPKQSPEDRRKELIELASKSKDKSVPVFTGRDKPSYFESEKEVLRRQYPRHTKVDIDRIPEKLSETKKAGRPFIMTIARKLGFRPSEDLIENLSKYSRDQVEDWFDNLAHPYIRPRDRK